MNKQEIERAIYALENAKLYIFENSNRQDYSLEALDRLSIAVDDAVSSLEHQLTNGWIPVSERLPQLPDGRSFINLNATILSPSGLRNTVPLTWELKRGKPTWCYLGLKTDWNVIAWQPLTEPYKEELTQQSTDK